MPVIYSLLSTFKVNGKYTEEEIKDGIEKINIKYNVKLKSSVYTLKLYFDVSQRTTISKNGEREKGYKILDEKAFSIR